MILFILFMVVYGFEALRSEIMLMDINHKLSRFTEKRLSLWWCLAWPVLYFWIAFRKNKIFRKVRKFLMYKEMV